VTADQAATEPGASARRAATTLPALLLERAEADPQGAALRHKQLGIWHSVSWSQLAARVEAVAAALHEAGVDRGDVVVVLSDNRPEWLVLELAAQSVGAAVVGPHPECGADELRGVLRVTGAGVLVVEDDRQLDKLDDERLGELTAVVCVDVRGVDVGTGVRSFAALEAAGRVVLQRGWWRERVASVNDSDVAVLSLPDRAGATVDALATPAPVALTHATLLAASTSFTLGEVPAANTRYVSVLPLGWSWEQVAGVTGWLRSGFPLNLPEGPATQLSDLRDIGPDVVLAPARAWEAMAVDVQAAAADAGRVRGGALRWAQTRTGASRQVADALVLRTVRDRLGLTRIGRAWTFGAPLSQDVLSFFSSVGVDLRQLYGADAAGGPIAAQTSGDRLRVRPYGGVGSALPGVELRVSDQGEVLVRSSAVPAGRADADGWLHTGDRGELVDGQLVLLDRVDDVLLAGAAHVSPSQVEAHLRSSRYIEDAVVVLPAGGPLSALVVVDAQSVGEWAERKRLHAPNYEALTRLPEVGALLCSELASYACRAPGGAAVRRVVVLPRRLDPVLGEVTRTLVVRRRVVLSHFPAQVAALGNPPEDSIPVLDVPEGAA
jgi:long-chain acyl-CoA synthetase